MKLLSFEYLQGLCRHHLSSRLKIAPEHISPRALWLMNKGRQPLDEFRRLFKTLCRGRRQELKTYFLVAHPGTTDKEARELARHLQKLRREGENPIEGVQAFTPTPMTRSTCMYYTGKDPASGEAVFVPRTFAEKKALKRLLLETVEREIFCRKEIRE